MRESDVEFYLDDRCRELGWLTRKFVSPGRTGVADRIVIPAGGKPIFFVELKAPGKVPHAKQEREHERMRALGQRVYVCDSPLTVDLALSIEVKR